MSRALQEALHKRFPCASGMDVRVCRGEQMNGVCLHLCRFDFRAFFLKCR